MFRSARLALFILSILLFLPRSFAQSTLAGDWQGMLDTGGQQFHVAWHVTIAPDGTLTSTVDNVDQSIFGIKVKKTEVRGSDVSFSVDDVADINGQPVNIAGTFAGKLSSDQTEVEGEWTQTAPNEGGPFELKMKHQPGAAAAAAMGQAATAPASPAAAPATQAAQASAAGTGAIAGEWQGVLMGQLHLVLHIKAGADGALSATLDSVDQGANGIPVSAITLKDGKLSMTVDAVHGTYDGTVSKDGNEIDGTWSQGNPLPLNFTRGATPPVQPAAAASAPKP